MPPRAVLRSPLQRRMIATLMLGPRTRRSLAEACGMNLNTAQRYLQELEAEGVVTIVGKTAHENLWSLADGNRDQA